MPWFRIDDTFAMHPKAVAAGNAALGLWVRAGSWCAQQLTDGFVPRHMLPSLGGRPRDAKTLVECGLWNATEDGWQFHDWEDYQPTREQVSEQRKHTADRVRRWREQRRSNAVTEDDGNGVTEAFVTPPPVTPPPTRPDPTLKEQQTTTSSVADNRRGTRLPDDFTVTDDMRQWAYQNCPGTGPQDHERFMDYWRAVPGAKGRKTDWEATWRNWMRKESEQRQRPTVARSNPNSADNRMARAREIAARLAAEDAQRLELEASPIADLIAFPSVGEM